MEPSCIEFETIELSGKLNGLSETYEEGLSLRYIVRQKSRDIWIIVGKQMRT